MTPEPTASTTPQNSWPTCIGTGIVRCAQASHFQMWTSVPQIEVLRILISTSIGPTSGSGTSCSHNPGSAFAFTSAFINQVRRDPAPLAAGSQ